MKLYDTFKPEIVVAYRNPEISCQFSLTWSGLTFTPSDPESKEVIDSCDGFVKPGEMLVIMGSADSPRSTLLKLLADVECQSGFLGGEILFNGHCRTKDYKEVRSFVDFEDRFVQFLSVRETLRYAAALSIPRSCHSTEFELRISRVVKLMELDRVMHTLVGGCFGSSLTGCERKCLSIAIALLKEPALLFLDDPTFMMSCCEESRIIQHLKNIAKNGCSVIMTSSRLPSRHYFTFDSIVLMADSVTVFVGTPKDSLHFLSHSNFEIPNFTNPSDFVLEVLDQLLDHPEKQKEMGEKFLKSEFSKTVNGTINELTDSCREMYEDIYITHKSNHLFQFYYICRRNFLTLFSSPGGYLTRLLLGIFLVLIIGSLYKPSKDRIEERSWRARIILYTLSYSVFIILSQLVICFRQKQIFFREKANDLVDSLPFVLAYVASSAVGGALVALIPSFILAKLVDLHRPLQYGFLMWISLFSAEAFLFFFTCLCCNVYLSAILLGSLFSVYTINEHLSIPDAEFDEFWAGFLKSNFLDYAFAVLMYNECHDNYEDALRSYNWEDVKYWHKISILLAITTALYLFSYVILRCSRCRR